MSTYKLIQLQNQWILAIDENVRKEDGWCYDMYSKKIITPEENLKSTPNTADYYCKIIAGIETLPLVKFNNDELANKVGYVDVYKLANEQFDLDTKKIPVPTSLWYESQDTQFYSFIKGFQKAQSLNENKYSLEEMMGFASEYSQYILRCKESNVINPSTPMQYFENPSNLPKRKFAIQSLSKPKMWDVEIDMMLQVRHGADWYDLPNQKSGNDRDGIYQYIPKITDNSILITKIL